MYKKNNYLFCEDYLNLPEVQNALNVGESSIRGKSNITAPWNMCNDIVNGYWLMTDFIANTTHLYSDIFNHVNKPSNFKMLVFSGDSDGVIIVSKLYCFNNELIKFLLYIGLCYCGNSRLDI